MPGNLYYLVASLPHLTYHGPPPIAIDDFFSACKTHLHHRNIKKLRSIRDGDFDIKGPGLSALRMWSDWDLALRGELARFRMEQLDRPSIPSAICAISPDGGVRSAFATAHTAFHAASPEEADDAIESAKWAFLDSLEFGRYFNLETLAIYLLKLKILERKAAFSSGKGGEVLEGTLDDRRMEIRSYIKTGI